MIAAYLTYLGWRVTFLGATIPADDLGAFLADEKPHALVLSCSLTANLRGARESIRAAHDAGVPVVAGGRAFGANDERATAIGADGWLGDPRRLDDLLRTWDPNPAVTEANVFDKLEETFRTYGDTGSCERRYYLHSDEEAKPFGQKPGEFTPWETISAGTDLLFYEGLHGGIVTDDADVAKYVDLLIGVVPIVNLEWIQKIHRDCEQRGYSAEAVTDTILRRMYDYEIGRASCRDRV